MRPSCCVHQPSSTDHHHCHHHQPCHASFPPSTSVPLFSASSSSTGMGTSTGSGGGNGGGCGLTTSSGGGSHHSCYHHSTVFNGTATLPASYSSNGGDHFASPSATSSCSYFRSRTIGPNAHQQQQHCALLSSSCSCEHPNSRCQLYGKPWLPFSRRAIALFALSLVFILIWSSVVSFVLLSDSYKEQQRIRQTAELFELHRDVGQLAFEMGDEMLYTLNATMDSMNQLDFQTTNTFLNTSNTSTTTATTTIDTVILDRTTNENTTSLFTSENSSLSTTPTFFTNTTFTPLSSGHPIKKIHFRWNKTDALLRQIGQSLATRGFLDFESDVHDQLEKLRGKCVHQVGSAWPSVIAPPQLHVTPDPLTRIAQGAQNSTTRLTLARASVLWPVLTDCVRTFEQSFAVLDGILMKEHFASLASRQGEKQQQQQHAQYSKMAITDLLIRNMPYTLFVRGIVHRFTTLSLGLILVRSNFTQSFNVSEYFHYYYSSRQLIESSFVWNYRFLAKYQELERTDYQADMLLTFFDTRRALENDFYLKMSAIFSRVFSLETLKKIRSYIKKKNVESVERLLVNGSATKFIADQEANLMNMPLNTDLIELMGLENIEQVMYGHEQLLSQSSSASLQQKYDRLLRNQIGFMSRVQDFLNISLSGHLSASTLQGEQSLHYYTVLCTILLLSVFFTLTLFTCSGCCYRSPNNNFSAACCCSPSAAAATGKTNVATSITTFSRRFRRRLWNINYSPFSLFKLCFGNSSPFFSSSSSGSAAASATSPPRYPLLYKSTYLQPQSPSSTSRPFGQRFTTGSCGSHCHPHHYNHHHHHHHHHNSASMSSPSSHQMITAGRRTAAAVANRSNFQSTTTSRELSKTAAKTDKSRLSDKPATITEVISLISDSRENAKTSATEPSCMCCIDSGCSTQQQQQSSSALSFLENSDLLENNKKDLQTATAELNSSTDKCNKCSTDVKCSACLCKTPKNSEEQFLLTKNAKELKSNSSTSVVSSNSSNSKESTKKSSAKQMFIKTP